MELVGGEELEVAGGCAGEERGDVVELFVEDEEGAEELVGGGEF